MRLLVQHGVSNIMLRRKTTVHQRVRTTLFILQPKSSLARNPEAEKEWKDFIEAFTDVLVETDEQIPHLPPKDVTHRIYRDVSITFLRYDD